MCEYDTNGINLHKNYYYYLFDLTSCKRIFRDFSKGELSVSSHTGYPKSKTNGE